MAKEIIVTTRRLSGTETTYQVIFWFPIATGRVPVANGSLWSGASPTENTSIQQGAVLEESYSFAFPTGIASSAVQAYLQQAWANRNAQLGGVGANQYNGVYYDPTGGGWA